METFYLVDFENVGSSGVSKCSELKKTDHLHIFYTENSKKIDLDIIDNHGEALFETHKVPAKSQSVDMHIVSYMGYLIGKYENTEISIVVISKDKDYDNLIKFWDGTAKIKRNQKIEAQVQKKAQNKTQKKETQPANKDDKKAKGTASKQAGKTAASDMKTMLNSEIQKTVSQSGYAETVCNYVAKLVSKHYGEKNFKCEVHNELRQKYTDYEDVYKVIKPVLNKFDD